jgi:glutathione S-transferase
MKLYEFAPTRSIRARWTLQELGVDFEAETVNLTKGEHRRPEFLAINPAGKLPVLVDGDLVLTESVAIVLYLAEKYPERGFLPRDLAQRAEAYRWLLFATTELEQPLWRIARNTVVYPEEQRLSADVPIASREFTEMAAVLDGHMRGRRVSRRRACGRRRLRDGLHPRLGERGEAARRLPMPARVHGAHVRPPARGAAHRSGVREPPGVR